MRVFLNAIFLTLVVLVSFVVFFPKDKLYFLAQEMLKEYSVKLVSKELDSNAFSLEIRELDVFLSGSRVANISYARVGLLGIKIEDARADGTFKDMLPVASSIETGASFERVASASGSFGEVVASFNLSEKKLLLEAFIDEKTKQRYKSIFVRFKKSGDRYVYEVSL